jgi:dolichyl-phosphate-mannose--protein O-mannosyl transferase
VFVRTPILNWIVGPAFVVTVVVVLTPLLSRSRGGRS